MDSQTAWTSDCTNGKRKRLTFDPQKGATLEYARRTDDNGEKIVDY